MLVGVICGRTRRGNGYAGGTVRPLPRRAGNACDACDASGSVEAVCRTCRWPAGGRVHRACAVGLAAGGCGVVRVRAGMGWQMVSTGWSPGWRWPVRSERYGHLVGVDNRMACRSVGWVAAAVGRPVLPGWPVVAGWGRSGWWGWSEPWTRGEPPSAMPDRQDAVGGEGECPVVLVDHPVMRPAQRNQVGWCGWSTCFAVDDVVQICVGCRCVAAGEPAALVAGQDRPS